MVRMRAVLSPLLISLLAITTSHAEETGKALPTGAHEACNNAFKHFCPEQKERERKAWLEKILKENHDENDDIKKETENARKALGVNVTLEPHQQMLTLTDGEKSTDEIQKWIGDNCVDYNCLKQFYEPVYLFFSQYAAAYELKDSATDNSTGQRAVRALKYMDQFKETEDKEGLKGRIRMTAVSTNRLRSYGKMSPSIFYDQLLERYYLSKYREKAEASSGIKYDDAIKLIGRVKESISTELEKTAAGEAKTELLGNSYVDILKHEWKKMKLPTDDNIEEAIKFYREEYQKGKKIWEIFGTHTASILSHASALLAIDKKYPKDKLALVSQGTTFDRERFLQPIKNGEDLILPQAFIVEAVYRTNDKNMGILAFHISMFLIETAFESTGKELFNTMDDKLKKCNSAAFNATYKQITGKEPETDQQKQDMYFFESVQAALRTITPGGFDTPDAPERVRDFYERLAKEYCHDTYRGTFLINGAAHYFNPFTKAFDCKQDDKLVFKDTKCFAMGNSNLHRRSVHEL